MKKIVTILTVIVMVFTLSLAGCDNKQGNTKTDGNKTISSGQGEGDSSGEADPITLSSKILVVSDVHTSADTNTKDHLKKTLLYALETGVDAVIFNGDTADLGNDEHYSHLDGVFEEAFAAIAKAERPELIFNIGNHEFYPSGNCAHEETVYSVQLSKFKAFAEKWGAKIEDNVFVRDINGIKCVIAFPSDENSYIANKDIILKSTGQKLRSAGETVYMAAAGGYSRNDVNKVKAKFEEIVAGGYDKTIVFCTHHPLGETYGSTQYGMYGESETMFKEMLKDYPQTVHLAGHTHFSSLHERSFMQNDWTSIQIGTHTYGKYVSSVDFDEDGRALNYANITSKRYNNTDPVAQAYHGKTHFGMLLTFDNEKMTAERINLSKGDIYQHGSWIVPYGITKENKHDKFYYEDGERQSVTLHFAADADVRLDVVNGKVVGVSFEDVEEYWACEGYEITLGDKNGNLLKRILWSSHFWMGLKEKQTYNIALSDIPVSDGYTVRIRAIDFFGKYSEPCGDNVQVQETTENHPHKTLVSKGSSYTFDADELKAYTTVSFYYKIESGSKFAIAIIGDNWGTNYYGYFNFTSGGVDGNYAGVTCVEQPDGYWLVTMTLANVTKTNGSAPDKVKSLYLHGIYNEAEVYLDGISFND